MPVAKTIASQLENASWIRKMFEEVGHFVEKVRRVGFGPLVLDVPPGETRELSDEEVTQLKRASRRKAASGAEKPVRRPRSGPAALPRPVRKRIKTRSSPSNN